MMVLCFDSLKNNPMKQNSSEKDYQTSKSLCFALPSQETKALKKILPFQQNEVHSILPPIAPCGIVPPTDQQLSLIELKFYCLDCFQGKCGLCAIID